MIATLDHNCLIDLEEDGAPAHPLKTLITAHRQGCATLRVVAVGASERTREGSSLTQYGVFEARLQRLDLCDLPVIKPLGVYDVTYYDHCLLADDEMVDLHDDLKKILFPGTASLTRSQQCDVLSMWAHIYHGGDTFITRAGNFSHHANELATKGAGAIMSPADALAALARITGGSASR